MNELTARLVGLIGSYIDVDETMETDICDLFYVKTIEKDDYFLKMDEALVDIGFVGKGVFRYYYIDLYGDDITKYFCYEDDFVMSFTAFTTGTSTFYIQALEDCEILCIKCDDLRHLMDKNPKWLQIYTRLLENSYLIKEQREADFLFYNATERYQRFVKQHPYLVNRLQQQHIASYLGITPVSLSRIKGQPINIR